MCLGGGGVDRKEWQQKIKRMNLMIPLNSKGRGTDVKLRYLLVLQVEIFTCLKKKYVSQRGIH